MLVCILICLLSCKDVRIATERESIQTGVDEGNDQHHFNEPGDTCSGALSLLKAHVPSNDDDVLRNSAGYAIDKNTQFFLRAVKYLRRASSQNGYIGLHASRVCFMGQTVEADPPWWHNGS